MNPEVSRQPARSLEGWAGVTSSTKLRRVGGRHGSVTIPSLTGVIAEPEFAVTMAMACSELYSAVEGLLLVDLRFFKGLYLIHTSSSVASDRCRIKSTLIYKEKLRLPSCRAHSSHANALHVTCQADVEGHSRQL